MLETFLNKLSGNLNESEYIDTIETIRNQFGTPVADYVDDKMDSEDGEVYTLMRTPEQILGELTEVLT